MVFHMVANQSSTSKMSVNELSKLIPKLKMAQDKKNTKNMKSWGEGVRTRFTLQHMDEFLGEYSSIRLPPGQVSSTLVQRQVNHMIQAKKRESIRQSVVISMSSII